MEELLKKIIPLVVRWHKENRKALPWREDPTPYHVWLSEIMLQQTRIETVIPYYRRFLAEAPTIEALASIDDEKLLKLWEGLGYYSRARNLKKTAQLLVAKYNGKLPEEANELKKLFGIGDYTAGAISSIAYGRSEPAVDGNVLRVFMRITENDGDIAEASTRKYVTQTLRKVYPSGRESRLLTEGLMELGELVCIPNGSPKCDVCPLFYDCLSRLHETTERFPVKSERAKRKTEEKTIFLLRCGEKYALKKRSDGGLLAGLWEFPSVDKNASPMEIDEFLKGKGIFPLSVEPCGSARHIFTHLEWRMTGFLVECEKPSDAFTWASAEDIRLHYAVPTAFSYFLKQL